MTKTSTRDGLHAAILTAASWLWPFCSALLTTGSLNRGACVVNVFGSATGEVVFMAGA